MKNITKHILLQKQYNLHFLHNNNEVVLSAGINSLNNNWMWWFDIEDTMSYGTKNDIKDLVKNIRKKTIILKDDFLGEIK